MVWVGLVWCCPLTPDLSPLWGEGGMRCQFRFLGVLFLRGFASSREGLCC
jgi:hypothetical protein